jgi:hypothetical protein
MTSSRFPARIVRPLTLAVAAAVVFVLGVAWASPAQSADAIAGVVGGCGHDQNLNDADNSLLKASEHVKVSQNPGIDPPFDGHDSAALRAINHAREEIAKAIAFSENSCN